MRPRIAIILVNYKNYKDTLNCIESLKKVNYPNLLVIVVDNNSKDESYEMLLKESDENIKVIESGFNGGFAYGNNCGIRVALEEGAQYVLLLNNDTIVDENFLEPLVNKAESDELIGIVSSRIMFYPESHKIWYAGGAVDWKNLRAIHFGLKEDYTDAYAKETRVDFASGCCMLIPKKIFSNVGFLPEEYFMYCEDMDFCIMVTRAGYEIHYVPESVIYHCVSSSSGGEGSPFSIEWQTRARRIFWKKYRGNFSKLGKLMIPIMCDCRTIVKCLVGKNKIIGLKAFCRAYQKDERNSIVNMRQ